MNRMIKRLLAAVLVTSMLLGSNGISYAAEIADGDSIAGTEEVTQEAVDEKQTGRGRRRAGSRRTDC